MFTPLENSGTGSESMCRSIMVSSFQNGLLKNIMEQEILLRRTIQFNDWIFVCGAPNSPVTYKFPNFRILKLVMEKSGSSSNSVNPEDKKKKVSFKELSFSESPRGSELLKMKVENVISAYNSAMEESHQRTENVKQAVMREASLLVAKYEEDLSKKQEELGEKMNEMLENLTLELTEIGGEEEELKKFTSLLGHFVKDLPN